MNGKDPKFADYEMDMIIGNILRVGVMMAAVIVVSGGVIYLFRHGLAPVHYTLFQRVPMDLCTVGGILRSAFSFHGRGLIQLGLLFLIATPVARVLFSMIAFARQRDFLYTLVTAIVLVVLVHSLLSR